LQLPASRAATLPSLGAGGELNLTTIPPQALLHHVEVELARQDLLEFTTKTSPSYEAGWFSRKVAAEIDQFLADVAAGLNPRLMIFAPPRHGKSELVSRKFPAYALGRYPDLSIIATSYGADLASRMNRDVQRTIDQDSYREIFPRTRLFGKNIKTVASGSWLRNSEIFEVVGHKGGYRSAGVGQGITGMGGDIILIDDPIKDAEQANSQLYRDKVWDWYTSTLYTRCAPGAGILIVLTRWHEDDLAGRLLKAAENDGDQWKVISLPAIAEEDEEFRAKGEALHPERYSLDRLQKIAKAVGERVWSSLFQQHPRPKEGGLFKRRYFGTAPTVPEGAKWCRAWDLAATSDKGSGDPDYTAGVLMAKDREGTFYIAHCDRFRDEAGMVKSNVKMRAATDTKRTIVHLAQDPGQAGKAQVADYVRAMPGYMVRTAPVSGDKEVRATPLASQAAVGNVKIVVTGDPVKDAWIEPFLTELEAFPNGLHDDQVDAAADAFNEIAETMPGEGIMEYIRRLAEQKAAAGSSSGGGIDPAAAGLVALIPPAGTNTAYGMTGRKYALQADGSMLVTPEDAAVFQRHNPPFTPPLTDPA
jgi:predicted phage terminase large subunit-like protein